MRRRNGIILSYIYIVLNLISGIFLSAFLIRILGDVEYGLYQTITSFAMYLVMLEFGIGNAMTRNILIERNSKNSQYKINAIISTLMVMTLVLITLIVIISIFFYIGIPYIYANTMTLSQIVYGRKIFIIITIYLILSFIMQTISGIFIGYENYTIGQKINIFKLLSRTALVVAILLIKPYAIYIALVDMFISIMTLLFSISYIIRRYKISFSFAFFDKAVVITSLPLCLAMFIQVLVNQANNNVDKFLIGIMLSMKDVTIYSVAQYFYSTFSSITTVPITMYMPQVAKDIGRGLKGIELTKTLIQPSRLIALLGGVIVFGFFSAGKQFISILYGADKSDAWIYALIIMVPMLINMTNGILVNVLDILNKRLARSYTLLLTTIINIVLSIILLKYIGIIGAVIGTAIATILGQIVIMNIYYSREIKIKILYLYKEAFKGILVYQILAGVVGFFISKQISNIYISFFAGGLIFVVLFFAMYILRGANSIEKEILKKVCKRLLRN